MPGDKSEEHELDVINSPSDDGGPEEPAAVVAQNGDAGDGTRNGRRLSVTSMYN